MEEYREEKGSAKGLGLGVNVGVNLNLGGLQNIVSTLNDALAQTGGVATDRLADVTRMVREYGVENIKKLAEQGGQQAKELYNQLVSKLQQAAQQGEDSARGVLNSLGEKVEAAGEKMQDAASESGDVGSVH